MVGIHTVRRAVQLVLKKVWRNRRRIGVRHFEHAGDPAKRPRPGTRFQILFVLKPRLAEVNLRIDDTRQNMEARRIKLIRARPRSDRADVSDFLVFDTDVSCHKPTGRHHLTVAKHAFKHDYSP